MKIELKNVKYAEFASEETNCFEATVYIDGIRAGTAGNDGKGGSTNFYPFELGNKIDAYAKTLPPIDTSYLFQDGKEHAMDQSAETLVDDLLNKFLERRDLKRKCAKMVLYRIPGETYGVGEYHTLKQKYTPELRAKIVSKYGDKVEIVNDLFA